jgi:predicted kinase
METAMTAKVLVLQMGLPRSGKSTHAREVGDPIVSPDAIRLALHGKAYDPEREPEVWRLAETMVRALFLAGHKLVTLDATNTTRKRRDAWISEDWQRALTIHTTDPEVCKARARADGREDLLPVIERMNRQWQLPTDEEEFLWVVESGDRT